MECLSEGLGISLGVSKGPVLIWGESLMYKNGKSYRQVSYVEVFETQINVYCMQNISEWQIFNHIFGWRGKITMIIKNDFKIYHTTNMTIRKKNDHWKLKPRIRIYRSDAVPTELMRVNLGKQINLQAFSYDLHM